MTDAVGQVAGEVVVVAAAGQQLPDIQSAVPLRVVRDREPGLGPLAGMTAGFDAAANEACLVVSCDAPLLVPELLQYLVESLGEHDAAIPEVGERRQPLMAVYRRSRCEGLFRARLGAGHLSVNAAIDSLERLNSIEAEDLREYDPDLLSFMGTNTREDLARVEAAMLASQSKPGIGSGPGAEQPADPKLAGSSGDQTRLSQ